MPTQNVQNPDGSYTASAAGQTLSPGSYSASGAQPISVSSLQSPQSPLNIPPAPPIDTGASANASIPTPQSIIDQSTTPTAADTAQNTALGNIAAATGNQKSLATQQINAEAAAGIPTYAKTVNDLTTQLQGLNDQATALQNEAQYTIPNAAQVSAEGRGITAGGLAPITTSQLRMNQIKQGAIATQSLTLKSAVYAAQGNYALAKDAADKAAQVAFDASEQEIKHQQALLAAIQPTLNKEQTARATLLQTQLQDRQTAITNAREDFKTGQALAVAALKFFPNDTAAQFAAQQALKLSPTTPDYLSRVMNLVGKYQQDPVAAQAAVDAHKLSQANLAKVYADIQKQASDNQVLSVADAKSLGVPYGTTKSQAAALKLTPGGSGAVNDLKVNALKTAQDLLVKFDQGGSQVIGGTGFFTNPPLIGTAPGSSNRDYITQVDHLKSLLSLDNVKYLKGQGQVSDAERKLLDNASGIVNGLDTRMSDQGFKKSLVDLIQSLKDEGAKSDTEPTDRSTGATWVRSDGTYVSDGTQWVKQ